MLSLKPWKNVQQHITSSNSIRHHNCHGILHVRMLQAKHLPCAPGSYVRAVLSLETWKGKILTKRVKTLSSKLQLKRLRQCSFTLEEMKHNLVNDMNHKTASVLQPFSSLIYTKNKILDGQHQSDFLHAYNNKDTPIPTHYVDFMAGMISYGL